MNSLSYKQNGQNSCMVLEFLIWNNIICLFKNVQQKDKKMYYFKAINESLPLFDRHWYTNFEYLNADKHIFMHTNQLFSYAFFHSSYVTLESAYCMRKKFAYLKLRNYFFVW